MIQQFIFILAIIVLNSGLYIMLTSDNYIKKIIGLAIFQSSVLIFYIAFGKIAGGAAPIDIEDPQLLLSSPLPHVLMLTAIVVGFATMSVAFALVKTIKKEYGTISEKEILEQEEE